MDIWLDCPGIPDESGIVAQTRIHFSSMMLFKWMDKNQIKKKHKQVKVKFHFSLSNES
jgi:hypothetical protein